MKRYVALLRGINISGKNKVQMAELKKGFEGLAFEDIKTYLNSGNVIFPVMKYVTVLLKKNINLYKKGHLNEMSYSLIKS